MPRVKPFYAVKCNNTEPVVKTIAALGAGFDCCNISDIEQILKLGVETDRIIYGHPVKDPDDIKSASEFGINLMVFDNEHELVKIKSINPTTSLVLRILPFERGSGDVIDEKYGCLADRCEDLLVKAKKMDLNVVGVSFQIGRSGFDVVSHLDTIIFCRRVFDLAKTIGFNFNFLDIGGGFPGYSTEGNPTFADGAKRINKTLDEYFPTEENVVVIAEPGTYYVQSAFTYVLRVIGKRVSNDVYDYYLNDGVHGAFSKTVTYDKKVPDFHLLEDKPLVPFHKSNVWGSTLNPDDRLAQNIQLPELDIGDWLYVPNMGAYTTVLATSFCGTPPSNIIWMASDSTTSQVGF
ncbi:ornithine decarboxylase-like [Lingula anatina]|uniref:ornithine decarboxylase n=1 Tax=Lingula anatina TaxID=7574 RepID=A0A1S3I1W8_LINAN|nr:ornithine decarboxylase-like [Lingula anatina]|eukprot:XP_013391344.1 ornithine decarboxylase-like [Lingula anatina]